MRVHVGMYFTDGARLAEATGPDDSSGFEEISTVDMPADMYELWRELRGAAAHLFYLEKRISELPRLERADG